jgi:hypothetical protein
MDNGKSLSVMYGPIIQRSHLIDTKRMKNYIKEYIKLHEDMIPAIVGATLGIMIGLWVGFYLLHHPSAN